MKLRRILAAAAMVAVLPAFPGANPRVPGEPFGVGEKLTFSVQYGLIKAGIATMEVSNGGNGLLLVTSRARSNSFFDKFFKVRDEVQAWIDPETLETVRFKKSLREGGYSGDEEVEFDWERNIARYADGTEVEIEPGFRDVLTSFYYLRTLRLPVGGKVPMTYHSSKKNWPVYVDIHNVEMVKTPAGEFRCFRIEPYLKTVGVFKQTGRLSVWITADERRIPVKLESKVIFGAFEAVLTDYRLAPRSG